MRLFTFELPSVGRWAASDVQPRSYRDTPRGYDRAVQQFVLIGAAFYVDAELGIDLQPERETLDHAELFRHLGLEARGSLIEPLVTGEWL